MPNFGGVLAVFGDYQPDSSGARRDTDEINRGCRAGGIRSNLDPGRGAS
jgi:hypothetical protein